MNRTTVCHIGNEKPKTPLHYKACGLDHVYLLSGYEIEETGYGKGVRIRNADGLHKVIGASLVRDRKLLTGKEIRFLRQQMDLTQSELARFFGCHAQTVARYEKEECDMPGAVDHILRLLFKEHLSEGIGVRELLTVLDAMDDRTSEKLLFEVTDDSWHKIAA